MQELLDILKQNQHDASAPVHLSASSLSKHMRCPRAWQESYIYGNKGVTGGGAFIGLAFHAAMSRLNNGEELGDPWKDQLSQTEEVAWGRDNEEKSRLVFEKFLYHYWEQVGKHLSVQQAETEYFIDVEGVDIPVNAKIDAELSSRIIDYKTTAYFSRKGVRVNKEWKFQMGVYQLAVPKPAEMHVITRDKNDPIVIPTSTEHPLYFGHIDTDKIQTMIRDEWKRILFHWETYGTENLWPGNSAHEWAGKYCNVDNCCAL